MRQTLRMGRTPGHEVFSEDGRRFELTENLISQRGSDTAFSQDTSGIRKPGHDSAASLVQVSLRVDHFSRYALFATILLISVRRHHDGSVFTSTCWSGST
jgi:hypothetical protein